MVKREGYQFQDQNYENHKQDSNRFSTRYTTWKGKYFHFMKYINDFYVDTCLELLEHVEKVWYVFFCEGSGSFFNIVNNFATTNIYINAHSL